MSKITREDRIINLIEAHLKTLECYDIPLQMWLTELRGTQQPTITNEQVIIVNEILINFSKRKYNNRYLTNRDQTMLYTINEIFTTHITQLEQQVQDLKIDNYQIGNLIKKYHNIEFPNLRKEISQLEEQLNAIKQVVTHKLNCLDGEITDVEAKIQSGALNTFVLKGRLEDLTNEYKEWQSILKEEIK